jgi:hypothetical protein
MNFVKETWNAYSPFPFPSWLLGPKDEQQEHGQMKEVLARAQHRSMAPGAHSSTDTLVLQEGPEQQQEEPVQDRPTGLKGYLMKFIVAWFTCAALGSTLISLPISMALLPVALVSWIPLISLYFGIQFYWQFMYSLFGPSGWVWKGFYFLFTRTWSLLTGCLNSLFGFQTTTLDIDSMPLGMFF